MEGALIIIILAVLIFIFLFLRYVPLGLWINARASGAKTTGQ